MNLPLSVPLSAADEQNHLLNRAMLLLAEHPGALFIGQGVACSGHALFKHLEGVPKERRLEFPVAEELQLGLSIGLALEGDWLPVSIFPRCDFLWRAADQLINHLDPMELMSRGDFQPKVIIRTRVGSKTPLDAGPQHTKNSTAAFRELLQNVVVDEIRRPDEILPTYQAALERDKSTLIVENLPC